MARSIIEDPLKVFRFRIVMDGIQRAGFSEMSGMDSETEVAEYREGGFNATAQKSAGLTKYSNITLKRGQIVGSNRGGDNDFVNWVTQVVDLSTQAVNQQYRRDIRVQQFDATNALVRVWVVYNAWPQHFKPFSDFNALGNDNSIEEVTLANEGWTLV